MHSVVSGQKYSDSKLINYGNQSKTEYISLIPPHNLNYIPSIITRSSTSDIHVILKTKTKLNKQATTAKPKIGTHKMKP